MKDQWKTLVGIGALALIAVILIWQQQFWLLAIMVVAGAIGVIANRDGVVQ